MNRIIFIIILFSVISLNLFGKYKYEDFYKTVDLSECKNAREMLYTLENCHNIGEAINSRTTLWTLVAKIEQYVDYYYYTIGAYKYLINYYNTGDEYTKELMQDIYKVCSNFKLSGITSYKENKKYTSYEFAALLFNDSKEYTVDDYMDILNFGYKTNILSREYLLNYLRDRDNFFLEGTHYYLGIFPITIEYKGKTIPKVTDSLTEFYYDFYGTKFKVEKITIKENDTWVDIYNKYGDMGITRGADYKLVSEIESYKSKTSNYYERLNDITNTFNNENNTIFTNFHVYYSNSINYIMENRNYYTEIYQIDNYYKDYYKQFDFMQNNALREIEDGNYYNQLLNLGSKIKKNVNSINDLEINISRLKGEILSIKYNLDETENEIKEMDKDSSFARILANSISNYKLAIKNYEERIKEYKKEIEETLKDIKNLEVEFEKLKKEFLKKWLEYSFKNERIQYLTIPEEFIGEYFYKVS